MFSLQWARRKEVERSEGGVIGLVVVRCQGRGQSRGPSRLSPLLVRSFTPATSPQINPSSVVGRRAVNPLESTTATTMKPNNNSRAPLAKLNPSRVVRNTTAASGLQRFQQVSHKDQKAEPQEFPTLRTQNLDLIWKKASQVCKGESRIQSCNRGRLGGVRNGMRCDHSTRVRPGREARASFARSPGSACFFPPVCGTRGDVGVVPRVRR